MNDLLALVLTAMGITMPVTMGFASALRLLRAFCVQNRGFWSIRGRWMAAQVIDIMVGVAGFEPATPASRT
jgi:hypothetical protein